MKEEINMKKVLFIPTASIYEEYKGYVGSARKLFKKLGAVLTEMEISKEDYASLEAAFNDADIIYFTGGNSFFLLEQLRKKGVDKLLKEELNKGKLFIGESAGAIVCAPDIKYIEMMDEKPGDYSLTDDGGLSLINFYVLPHYLTAPFKKITEKILEQFNNLDICPINNSQAVIIEDSSKRIVEI